jgi:DNA-binding XRE family transcriptional regulator
MAEKQFDLKAAREKHGYTQTQTAEILDVDQSTIARWERTGEVPMIYRRFWVLYHSPKNRGAAK